MTELIDKYLKGELSEEERVAFEKRVEEDPYFRGEVKGQIKAEYAIRTKAKKVKKQALKAEYARLVAETDELRRIQPLYRRSSFLIVAAAAVVLLIVAVRLWGNSPKMNADELFAAYIQPVPLSFSRSESDTAMLSLATAYQGASYAQAISAAERLLKDSAYASSAQLWLSLAISQLMTDQPQAALRSLKQIEPGSAYEEQALWYEALALLKVDPALARGKLAEIADSGHYMQKKAGEMLERMEEE